MRKSRNKKLCLTALALMLAASGVFTVLGSKNVKAEDCAVAKSAGSTLNEEYSASDYAAKIGKSDGATANFTANEKQYASDATFGGIKLTGGAGAEFELGSFIVNGDKFYWGSTERDAEHTTDGVFTGDRQGFLTFVYAPNSAAKEISELVVTLTDVNDESEYVSFKLSEHNSSGYLKIQAAATNNGAYACERLEKGGKTLGYNLPRDKMQWLGNQTVPVELIYDNEKASAYTNTTYSVTSNTAIGGVYVVRNFNSDVSEYCSKENDSSANDGDVTQGSVFYKNNGFKPWAGFKEGAEVKCTVGFKSLNGVEESSIILTSFAGEDLSGETISVSHDNDALSLTRDGETFDLNGETVPANGEIRLPNVKRINPFTGVSDFKGKIIVTEPNGSEIFQRDYENGLTVGSDILNANGAGEYTVSATDEYGNSKFTYKVNVYPVIGAEYENSNVKIDGAEVKNGDFIPFVVGSKLNVVAKSGYEVTEITVNGSALYRKIDGALPDKIALSVVTAAGINKLKITVSLINYTLKYELKGGGATGLQDKTFTVNDVKNETFSLETPKKEGYSFGGWYLDGKKIDNVSRLPLSDVTLYGAFTKEHKKITFVTDGGEETVNLYGDDFGAYVPEKDGYVFDGWVTETGEKANIDNLENGAKVYAKFVKESEIFSETASDAEAKIGAEIVDGEILGAYKIGVPEIIAFALAGGGLAAMIYALTAYFKKSKSKGE